MKKSITLFLILIILFLAIKIAVAQGSECTDSDGGYYKEGKGTMLGTLNGVYGEYTDFCKNSTDITEYSCLRMPDDSVIATKYEGWCDYICVDGACVIPEDTSLPDFWVEDIFFQKEPYNEVKNKLSVNVCSANNTIINSSGLQIQFYVDNKLISTKNIKVNEDFNKSCEEVSINLSQDLDIGNGRNDVKVTVDNNSIYNEYNENNNSITENIYMEQIYDNPVAFSDIEGTHYNQTFDFRWKANKDLDCTGIFYGDSKDSNSFTVAGSLDGYPADTSDKKYYYKLFVNGPYKKLYYTIKCLDREKKWHNVREDVIEVQNNEIKNNLKLEISSLRAEYDVTSNDVFIRWSTNMEATSKVIYRQLQVQNIYDIELVGDGGYRTEHNIRMSNVGTHKVFMYKAKSTDRNGNEVISSEIRYPSLEDGIKYYVPTENKNLNLNGESDKKYTTLENEIIKNKNMYSRLKGKIMLKVEDAGKAYYVNPKTETMHYLGRPDDAFGVMREQGVGITNANLEKIPLGLNNLSGIDTDNDGLPNIFEDAIGTDKNNIDTDGDGYSDKDELEAGFSPRLKLKKMTHDISFSNLNYGKIFLQVEGNGEAWYLNPNDGKRYFLGRPTDAFNLMRNLGLGITNSDYNLMIEN